MEALEALRNYALFVGAVAVLGCLCGLGRWLTGWAEANPRHPRARAAGAAARACAAAVLLSLGAAGLGWVLSHCTGDEPIGAFGSRYPE